MIRHIVLVRASADPATVESVLAEIGGLQAVVPGIVGFAGGANVSPENMARGYTHAFIVDFVDRSAVDNYLVHGAHFAAIERLAAAVEGEDRGMLVVEIEIAAS